MPLVKSAGVWQTVKNAPGAAAKILSENKVPAALIGGTAAVTGGAAFYRRAKERAREDALVDQIVNRNMQKEAMEKTALPFMPFMKTLGSGLWNMAKGMAPSVKNAAGTVGNSFKEGYKGMAKSFGNAGFTGVEKGMNTVGRFGLNAGRAAANRLGQFGQFAQQYGRKAWNTAKGWAGTGATVANDVANGGV